MAFQCSNYFLCVVLFTFKLGTCSFPKMYLETLLSQYHFKGYDLMASIKQDSEETLLSWLKDGSNSLFSLTLANGNLSESLESVMHKSASLEQIVVIIEFRNVSHLESEMKMAKAYSQITSVPQPYYLVVVPTAAAFAELQKRKNRLAKLASNFRINSDFYIFGESDEAKERKNVRSDNKIVTKINVANMEGFELVTQGFEGYQLPDGFAMGELYSIKNVTFFQMVDLDKGNLLQKVARREDFRNAPIVAARQNVGERSVISKYEKDQIDFMASSFNFSVTHIDGRGWIRQTADKKLTGMGQQLLGREADISISSSELLSFRAEQLSFLHPTYYTTIWGFFKQPASNSLRDIFIHAFTLDLWLTMFATWFLIIMAMFALAIVKWRLGTLHENDKIVVQEVFIWAAGAICQQGWHVCPESGSMKIVFIFALITGLVSYVGYSAALVSILSVKVIPIKSLTDLVNYRYTLFQDNGTLSTDDIIRNLERQMKLPSSTERVMYPEEGVEKLLKTQSAFLGVSDAFYPAARTALGSDLQVCKNIQKVSISQNRPLQCGMYVRKRSSLTEFFNHRVLLMHERGIRFRLANKFFSQTSVLCLDLSASEKEPLGFNDVVTAYVILLIGYVLSLTIFVLERMCVITLPGYSTDLNNFPLSSQTSLDN